MKSDADRLGHLDVQLHRLCSAEGRHPIALERLAYVSLIQIPFSVCSVRQMMEQMEYNPLFRGFVRLGIDDLV